MSKKTYVTPLFAAMSAAGTRSLQVYYRGLGNNEELEDNCAEDAEFLSSIIAHKLTVTRAENGNMILSNRRPGAGQYHLEYHREDGKACLWQGGADMPTTYDVTFESYGVYRSLIAEGEVIAIWDSTYERSPQSE